MLPVKPLCSRSPGSHYAWLPSISQSYKPLGTSVANDNSARRPAVDSHSFGSLADRATFNSAGGWQTANRKPQLTARFVQPNVDGSVLVADHDFTAHRQNHLFLDNWLLVQVMAYHPLPLPPGLLPA